jgi:hypothetical protein
MSWVSFASSIEADTYDSKNLRLPGGVDQQEA